MNSLLLLFISKASYQIHLSYDRVKNSGNTANQEYSGENLEIINLEQTTKNPKDDLYTSKIDLLESKTVQDLRFQFLFTSKLLEFVEAPGGANF